MQIECLLQTCLIVCVYSRLCNSVGILKVNDYHQIFKSSRFPFDLVTEYELLLAKFEVALRISDKELLVPSLLPDAKDAGCLDHEENKVCEVEATSSVRTALNCWL